jgi:glyoxylase-like metal-dependent hydrolase (beta-lactamase superfamily II)
MLVSKISDRVYQIDTMALGQAGTVAVYVIKGPKVTMVDCGYASSYETVLQGLLEMGINPSDVRYVIPTHVHLDHAGAAGFLLKSMPNAKLFAHEKAVPHLIDPSRLIQSSTSIFGDFIMQAYGLPQPIDGNRITAVGEEMHLDLGDGLGATIVQTPGHAPHQVSILLEKQKVLLTADAVGIVYPNLKTLIPTTPPPSFEPPKLVDSVNRLEQMGPKSLLVPHFGLREDTMRVFETTKKKVADWLSRVRAMRSKGMELDDIASTMQREIESEAGVSDLPIYAQLSVRITVMGMLNFLSRS